jgi:hypothetical protein
MKAFFAKISTFFKKIPASTKAFFKAIIAHKNIVIESETAAERGNLPSVIARSEAEASDAAISQEPRATC